MIFSGAFLWLSVSCLANVDGASKEKVIGCFVDDDCFDIINSVCTKHKGCSTGLCACPTGLRVDTDSSTCVKPSSKKIIGTECTKDSDCLAGVCDNSVCICPHGSAADDSKSCGASKLGATCNTLLDCGNYTQCTGECKCITGYQNQEDNINCAPYAAGDTCTDGETQCGYPDFYPASCVKGTCQCSLATAWTIVGDKSGCIPIGAQMKIAIGEACTAAQQGAQSEYPLVCDDGSICETCPDNSTYYRCISPPANESSMTWSLNLFIIGITVVSSLINYLE